MTGVTSQVLTKRAILIKAIIYLANPRLSWHNDIGASGRPSDDVALLTMRTFDYQVRIGQRRIIDCLVPNGKEFATAKIDALTISFHSSPLRFLPALSPRSPVAPFLSCFPLEQFRLWYRDHLAEHALEIVELVVCITERHQFLCGFGDRLFLQL